MRLLVDVPRPVMGWLERRAHCFLTANARAIAAVDSVGVVKGMIAFDDITNSGCEVHIALLSRCALRALIPACFTLPFLCWGLRVVVGTVPADNPRMLRLSKSLGFRETHRIQDGWAEGVALVLLEIRSEDCARWLAPKREVA